MLTQLYKKTIACLLLEKARELMQKPATTFTFCERLPCLPHQCRHKDFRNLSSMTDLSISTLSRLFKGNHTGIQRKINSFNQHKIVRFLEYENWKALEEDVLKTIMQSSDKE